MKRIFCDHQQTKSLLTQTFLAFWGDQWTLPFQLSFTISPGASSNCPLWTNIPHQRQRGRSTKRFGSFILILHKFELLSKNLCSLQLQSTPLSLPFPILRSIWGWGAFIIRSRGFLMNSWVGLWPSANVKIHRGNAEDSEEGGSKLVDSGFPIWKPTATLQQSKPRAVNTHRSAGQKHKP